MIKKSSYTHNFITGNYVHNGVVEIRTRNLRVTWTPELTQDLTAFHNIDAEAELTALLSEQVATEVNRQILNDIMYPFINGEPIHHNTLLPMAEQVMARTIGQDLVSVRPLNLVPMGRLYYIDNHNQNLVSWRVEDGVYKSIIGVSMVIKRLEFIPKKIWVGIDIFN